MAFDIQTTQRSPSGRSTSVIKNLNVDTGADFQAKAVGQGAEALSEGASILHRIQADNQTNEFLRVAGERMAALKDDFSRDPDTATYQQRYDAALSEIGSAMPKNGLAARGAQKWIADQKAKSKDVVLSSQLAQERDIWVADDALALENGQFDKLLGPSGRYAKGVTNGTYLKSEAQKLGQRARHIRKTLKADDAELAKQDLGAEIIREGITQDTVDSALDLVREQGLKFGFTTTEIASMSNLVKQDFDRADAIQKAQEQNVKAQEVQAVKASENAANEIGTTSRAQILSGAYDLTELLGTINADPNIFPGDKATAMNELLTFESKFTSAVKVPDVSAEFALKNMEEAKSNLATGNIDMYQYWDMFNDNRRVLSQTMREHYIQEAEPAYSKMVGELKNTFDQEATRAIVTRTEANLIELRQKVTDGSATQIWLDGATIKHQAEMLIDSDYKQAVLDMVADETNKNMDREKAKKRFNELLVEFSEKSWIDKYIETQGRSKELSRVEKKVADQFNAMILGTQEDAIRGVNYWEKLTAPNRARVHDQLADGASMADIARLLGDKEL